MSLSGLHQERDRTSSSFCSSLLRPVLSVNNTTNESINHLFFIARHVHEHELRDKTEKWRACKEQRLQCLVLSADKYLASTAPASLVGPFIGQNVITTTGVMQKPFKQGSVLADDPKSAFLSSYKDYILSVKSFRV